MPGTTYSFTPPIQEETAEEKKLKAERGNILQQTGANVVRGLAGFGGVTPITGAVFGGGGEAIAQMIEKGTINPFNIDYKRVAGEAAIGAAMGKWLHMLKSLKGVGKAATRGAIMGGSAPIVRHGIEGDFNPMNYPGEIATGAVIGGATSGFMKKMMPTVGEPPSNVPVGDVHGPDVGAPFPSRPNADSPEGLQISMNKARNRRPLSTNEHSALNKEVRGAPSEGIAANSKGKIATEIYGLGGTPPPDSIVDVARAEEAGAGMVSKEQLALRKEQAKLQDQFAQADLAKDTRLAKTKTSANVAQEQADKMRAKELADLEKQFSKANAIKDKEFANQARLDEIAKRKVGLVEGPISVTESVSGKTDEGSASSSQKFTEPKPEKGAPAPKPAPTAKPLPPPVKTVFTNKREAMAVAANRPGYGVEERNGLFHVVRDESYEGPISTTAAAKRATSDVYRTWAEVVGMQKRFGGKIVGSYKDGFMLVDPSDPTPAYVPPSGLRIGERKPKGPAAPPIAEREIAPAEEAALGITPEPPVVPEPPRKGDNKASSIAKASLDRVLTKPIEPPIVGSTLAPEPPPPSGPVEPPAAPPEPVPVPVKPKPKSPSGGAEAPLAFSDNMVDTPEGSTLPTGEGVPHPTSGMTPDEMRAARDAAQAKFNATTADVEKGSAIPVAPVRPKKGAPSKRLKPVDETSSAPLTPEEANGVKWVKAEYDEFPHQKDRAANVVKGKEDVDTQINHREAGNASHDDIEQVAGRKATRPEVKAAIEKGLAGTLKNQKEKDLFEAVRRVGAAWSKAAAEGKNIAGLKVESIGTEGFPHTLEHSPMLPPEAGGLDVVAPKGSTGKISINEPPPRIRPDEYRAGKDDQFEVYNTNNDKVHSYWPDKDIAGRVSVKLGPEYDIRPIIRNGPAKISEFPEPIAAAGSPDVPPPDQPRLPGAGHDVVNPNPEFEAPFSLTPEVAKGSSKQLSLQEEPPVPPPSGPSNIIPVESLKRTPAQVAGDHYGAVKAEQALEPKVPGKRGKPINDTSTPLFKGTRVAGSAADRLQKEANPVAATPSEPPAMEPDELRKLEELTAAKKAGSNPEPPGMEPDELAKLDALIEAKRKAGGSDTGAVKNLLLIRAALAGGGAMYGGATGDSPEDRANRALMFGLGGALLPDIATKGAKMFENGIPPNLEQEIIKRIPNTFRAGLLSDPRGLLYNTFGGPIGSHMMGGIEEATKGLVHGNPEQMSRGKNIMKDASNLPKWFKEYWYSLAEAQKRIEESELGRVGNNPVENPTYFDQLTAVPATVMTGGDINVKTQLGNRGVPLEKAQEITLTAEPKRALWRNLANFGKTKTDGGYATAIAQLMQPFKRTAANIMESGTERTPVLGYLINRWGDPALKIPGKDQLVQQGIGGIVFGLAYEAGLHTPSGTVKDWKLNTLVSNLGGQYALLSGAGFAAGQARRLGKSSTAQVVAKYLGDMPLPETAPIMEVMHPLIQAVDGEQVTLKDIPKSFVPKIFTFAQEYQKRHQPVPETPNSYSFTPPEEQ